jgi:hypothetical protein
MHIDAVEKCAGRGAFPAAREEIDAIAARCKTSKDFVKMNFGAASVRIFPVVPVDDENSHLKHARSARIGIEHAVHESRARCSAESFRKAHCFLNYNTRRSFTTLELGRSQSKNRAFYCTDALETPVVGDGSELFIETGLGCCNRANDSACEFSFIRRNRKIVPDLDGDARKIFTSSQVPGVQGLKCSRAAT